jgi:hypothetical protein
MKSATFQGPAYQIAMLPQEFSISRSPQVLYKSTHAKSQPALMYL